MTKLSFKRVQSGDHESVASAVSQSILSALQIGNSVLWLVSGGSCIPIAVRARKLLGELPDTSQLSVILMDERYGDIDHEGSNSAQLRKAGFSFSGLKYYEVLQGKSIGSTTNDFVRTVEVLRREADKTVGLFGMGADGHTAGLLPGNPLINSQYAAGFFDGPDYPRITMTPSFLYTVDQAMLYAVGENKWPALRRLHQLGSKNDLPARLLLESKELTIFSDLAALKGNQRSDT